MEKKIFYLCNRANPKCENCSYPEECTHTSDIEYAINFNNKFEENMYFETDILTEIKNDIAELKSFIAELKKRFRV